jgi:hypothetical protein
MVPKIYWTYARHGTVRIFITCPKSKAKKIYGRRIQDVVEFGVFFKPELDLELYLGL